MNGLQSLLERLRPLVGMHSWDYCVLWKLSDDQRFIEWMGCCCCGAESGQNGGEDNLFPMGACKDVMFQHQRTKTCDILAELPPSMLLDSGIHAQSLISSQPIWFNLSNTSDSCVPDVGVETVGTRVLIPVPGGLLELFVAKQVPEDQQIIKFVMSLCNISYDQEAMIVRNSIDELDAFADENPVDHLSKPVSFDVCTSKNTNNFQPWIPTSTDNSNFPWDISVDQMRLSNSPLNFFENRPKSDIFFEGSMAESMISTKPPPFDSAINHGFHDIAALQQSLGTNGINLHQCLAESTVSKEGGHDKESVKQEMGRADSNSDCSDQLEDDDDQKVVGRSGRKHQSKNLVAERNRRKKLNERLYALRALVPKITKMDRASILGDAIDFVKELQMQVKDLQDELEETSQPEEDGAKKGHNNNNVVQLEIPNQNGMCQGGSTNHEEFTNGSTITMADHGTRCSSTTKTVDNDDNAQQMEVQVEVSQVNGNEFFLKVLCEHKPGGFVRLLEAMSSFGLEVTNANVTTFRGLVLNVFKVEKRDNEVVQADHVRYSLLELTRNPSGASKWSMV
eukprot:TRINITY_DN1990_c0_g1_i1.p1 TRINITY_DN1990_c0_g1~~TRINITY_DN1990_c0_g1_i1.p1  ORF type:complete len:565 (+),score=82.99 TRINITY_DN1990_c0_g1_i1:148-1842(+)